MREHPENPVPASAAKNRRGSTLLEFVLAGSFVFLPLLAGVVTVGMSMLRSIQVEALNRDAGHMFASGMDFSQTANRNLLLKVAGDLGITDSGGEGVVILTEIDGTGANTAVCAKRLVIGNAALRSSSFCSPAGLDAGGNVSNTGDASASAATFTPSVMAMSASTIVYVAETYYSTSDYDWTGLLTGTGIYTKAIF